MKYHAIEFLKAEVHRVSPICHFFKPGEKIAIGHIYSRAGLPAPTRIKLKSGPDASTKMEDIDIELKYNWATNRWETHTLGLIFSPKECNLCFSVEEAITADNKEASVCRYEFYFLRYNESSEGILSNS